MEIDIDKYLSEEEKKNIVIDTFKERITQAFGGNEYSSSGKEADRIVKNAVAHWIASYVETILTDEDKTKIRNAVQNVVEHANYEFYLFQKPDVWDRTEFSFYKILNSSLKENQEFIAEKIKEELVKKLQINFN